METIILYCKTQEEALHAVNDICMDIKALPDDNQHQLFMNRRIFGMYSIFPGEKIGGSLINEPGKAEKIQPGDRELIFFPAEREEDFEKLKAGKNLVMVKNCNYIIGETRKTRRDKIIDWLLGKVDSPEERIIDS